jgi:hypothetical protein
MPPDLNLTLRPAFWLDRVPHAWRTPLAQLALAWA